MNERQLKIVQVKITSIRDTLFSHISLVFNLLKTSPRTLYYIVAVLIGLGLARMLDASLLAYIASPNKAVSSVKLSNRYGHNKISSSRSVDVLQIIGGPIFSEVTFTEEKEIEEVSQIDYTVLGTIDGHPSFARVVVNLLGNDEMKGTREYGIGRRIGTDRIIWIGREYVVVRRGEQKIKIKVGENALAVALEESKQQEKNTKGIRKTISRQDAAKILNGNPAAIYTGASFGPVLKNGNIAGYKIFKVKPSHLFYKIGARGGDIIRKINGFELNDTERMFELWKSMKTTSNVAIDLERNGKALKYDLNIVN